MGTAKSFANQAEASKFRKSLLRWYRKKQRKLPWRGETDPYRILVSEIMLQQTRVAVVKERYQKFLRQFPTARRLARAREQTVLAAWSGLGYYRRARALHAAAKEILGNGGFPPSSIALRALPGVGRYTANAVASIAFGETVPVVDGNVQRVLQRLHGNQFSDKAYWQAAGELLDRKHPGDFNQAMMELGALVCLPAQPLCQVCPVAPLCASRGAGARRKQTPRRKAVLNYALTRRNGFVFLQQRGTDTQLMPGMWELPALGAQERAGKAPLLKLRHSITTTDYTVFVFSSTKTNTLSIAKHPSARWIPMRSVKRLPLTGLTRKVMDRLALL
jgi:A/G-specific adenine glycosylase